MPDVAPMTRGLTCLVEQMDEDDEFGLLQPLKMTRGVSHYVREMN
jgi:hypothetical protein